MSCRCRQCANWIGQNVVARRRRVAVGADSARVAQAMTARQLEEEGNIHVGRKWFRSE